MSSQAIIDSITCPITATIMKDPVQGNDGQTYERSAITEWLTNHQSCSPITKEYMTVADLKVNSSIRFLCDKYHSGELNLDKSPPQDDKKFDFSINHPEINDSVFKNSSNFMVKLCSSDDASILSHDVILVIDRSGSMQVNVEAKDENGNSLEDGLSQQDIVNHSAKMIAKTLSLNSNNRLSIVMFDNIIEIVFDLMKMTNINCERAINQIDNIKPRGQTDIWRALEKAINMLSTRDDKSRNPHILLLTDGCPNISPSRGEVVTIEKKLKTLNFYPPIYTFGFGYNLKPDLLYNISKVSGGVVGHIPDGGMIATVFSNFIANVMCTIAYNVKLTIYFDGKKDSLPHIHGDFKYDIYKNEYNYIDHVVIYIGSIQLGQSRDMIISDGNIIKYAYNYQIGNQTYETSKDINSETQFGNEWWMDSNITRLFLVEKIRLAIKTKQQGNLTNNIYEKMLEHFNTIDIDTEGLWGSLMYETIKDQIRLAISDNSEHSSYFKRWGMWYLDQLSSSLCHQFKPNFKDSACCFGGKIFADIVDYASDQFDSLPPPVPSNSFNNQEYRSLGSISQPNQQIQMSSYNSQAGPCFDGNCIISMANGTKKKISELMKGDCVFSLENPNNINSLYVISKVVCILKTIVLGNYREMTVFDNGLKITPWHPILNEKSEWVFPFNINNSKLYEQKEVYNILLDSNHTCKINNTWCICLGHNYTQGILKHDFFGTQKVIENMKSLNGWEKGIIEIHSNSISRDIKTGLVCELLN